MKILRIFGIVLAVHAFAFILIFANPGCSTKPQQASAPAAEPVVTSAPPVITVPKAAPDTPIAFDPDAPATSSAIRYSPTRPNTAAATALQAEPVKDVTPATTVTVGKGDSLWSIAKKNGITVSELAAANNLRISATLRQGQKLIVPGKAGAPASSASAAAAPAAATPAAKTAATKADTAARAAANGGAVKYVVKPGESLGTIAKNFGVKQGDIAEANNITNPALIRAGQELVIPGFKVPGAAKAASAPAAVPTPPAPAPTPTINISAPEQNPPAPGGVPVIKVDDSAPAPQPQN
jgi:LysM repeat protein